MASRKNNKCFAPNCRSGYASDKKSDSGEKFSLFKAPNDPELLKCWRKNIPRLDRDISSRDVICEKHFTPENIVREWKSGSITIPYVRPKLKKDAVPTIFPDCPSYLSKKTKKRRLLYRSSIVPSKIRKIENSYYEDTGVEVEEFSIFKKLYMKEINLNLPTSWTTSTSEENGKKIIIFSEILTKNGKPVLKHQVTLNEALELKYFLNGKSVNVGNQVNDHAENLEDIENILMMYSSIKMCPGGPDEDKFNIKSSRISVIDKETGKWRHKDCCYVIKKKEECCRYCKYLYKVFQSAKSVIEGNNNKKTIKVVRNSSWVNKALRRKQRRLLNKLKLLKETVLKTKSEFLKMEEDIFDKKLNCLPENQRNMIRECINLTRFKSSKGRRYTPNWMCCMLLYIKSSSTYEYLRKNNIIPLCDISTVRRYLRSVNIQCGLDEKFFLALKRKMSTKTHFQKDGILLFDEIAVKSSITINPRTMKVDGYTDFGIEDTPTNSQKKELVDHALVFMFSALHDSYVQPVAVYGAKGATKGDVLTQLVIKVIVEITKAGGRIQGIICDGATTNRKMWSLLGISGQKDNVINSFLNPCTDEKIYVFSDSPHLFKCIRNRMHSQPHLMTPYGEVSWKYYRKLYELDTKLPGNLRVCPKISHSHIFPTIFLKMRVKLATQIFSKSVADGLSFYCKHNGTYMGDAGATIQFTYFLNTLFDSLNRKCYLDGIYSGSKDFAVLQDGLDFLNKWEDMKNNGQIQQNEFLTASTAEGLRVSLTSTIELSKHLLQSGYTFIATAKINQDALEVVFLYNILTILMQQLISLPTVIHSLYSTLSIPLPVCNCTVIKSNILKQQFFGIVRQSGGANDHPSFYNFYFLNLYKLLSVKSLIRPPKFGNCTLYLGNDQPQNLITLADIKSVWGHQKENFRQMHIKILQEKLDGLIKNDDWGSNIFESTDHDYAAPEIAECVLYYISGFICRKLLKLNIVKSCSKCVDALQSQGCNSHLADMNIKSYGYLLHPNKEFYDLLIYVEKYFAANISSSVNIYEDCLDHVCSTYKISFPCEKHGDYVISYLLHYFIVTRVKQFYAMEAKKQEKKSLNFKKQSKVQSN